MGKLRAASHLSFCQPPTHTEHEMMHHGSTSIDASMTSSLNPNAPAFVPAVVQHAFAYGFIDAGEAKRIDEAMAYFHHLAPVNDTETLNEVSRWLGNNPDEWVGNGMDYICPDGAILDDEVGFYCDQEDRIRDALYRAPQQAKGNTRARARPRR